MTDDATEHPGPTQSPEERGRSARRAAMLTAAVGIVFSVLFTVSLVLIAGVPLGHATDDEIRDYYSGENGALAATVGLYIMPFAGIAFLWFAVAMRAWASLSTQTRSVLQSNLQFVSAVIFVVLIFVAAAAIAVVAATVSFTPGRIDADIARQFPVFGVSLTLFFAMRMAAMFVFTTSAIGWSAGILPRWFAYAGFAVGGFLLLSASFTPFLVLLFPAWIIVLCVLLIDWARRIPTDVRLPNTVPGAGPLGTPRTAFPPSPPDERRPN